jgi:hypothetical protein
VTAARLPFLNVDRFTADEAPPPPPIFPALPARSPFLSVCETDGEDSATVPWRKAFAAFVDRLHDDEFEESLTAVHADGRAFTMRSSPAASCENRLTAACISISSH